MPYRPLMSPTSAKQRPPRGQSHPALAAHDGRCHKLHKPRLPHGPRRPRQAPRQTGGNAALRAMLPWCADDARARASRTAAQLVVQEGPRCDGARHRAGGTRHGSDVVAAWSPAAGNLLRRKASVPPGAAAEGLVSGAS